MIAIRHKHNKRVKIQSRWSIFSVSNHSNGYVEKSPFIKHKSNIPFLIIIIFIDETSILNIEQNLRERISSLEYQVSFLNDEKELQTLRHEQVVRDLDARIKSEEKRADKAESDKTFLFRRQETLSTEIKNINKDHDEYQSITENTIKDLRLELSKYQDENLQLKNKMTLARQFFRNRPRNEIQIDTEQQKNEELQNKYRLSSKGGYSQDKQPRISTRN